MTYRAPILQLYRSILKTHKKKLPVDMQNIGNKYVHSEFKSMIKATKEEHVKRFIAQWQNYLSELKDTKDLKRPGKDIEEHQAKKLSADQVFQLKKLRAAVTEEAVKNEENSGYLKKR
eukprot:TRINITY_DN12911_c0_g1_i2.p1 TRINITY_DN12911_c0_g1~~TRINITY_DN12911_c0_g1_i2.p1  ORF type:complete len:118 (-),score=16.54 TRINITY_DN12911_c0_g1_i2:16-369(-)